MENNDFESLLNTSMDLEKKFKVGDTVLCEVLYLDKQSTIMRLQDTPIEIHMPLKEFGTDIPEIGKTIAAEVVQVSKSHVRVSVRSISDKVVFDKLKSAEESKTVVKGKIQGIVKTGFLLELPDFGVQSFLPFSQFQSFRISDPKKYLHQTIDVNIIAVSKRVFGKNVQLNVISSRLDILKNAKKNAYADFVHAHPLNTVVEGKVAFVQDRFAIVQLNDLLEGIIPMKEVSWDRIQKVQDILRVGDTISVKIIEYNEPKLSFTLSLKQVNGDAWENFVEQYQENDKLQGVIVGVKKNYLLLSIAPGVMGLLNKDEISFDNLDHLDLELTYKKGETLPCTILSLDKKEKKVFLSMRYLDENPWASPSSLPKEGSLIKGVVRNIYGSRVWLSLAGNLNGYMLKEDISWDVHRQSFQDFFIGKEVEAKILQIHLDSKTVKLGLKQMVDNPWLDIESRYHKNDVVSIQVVREEPLGYIAILEDFPTIEGFLPKKKVPRELKPQVNEKHEAIILEISSSRNVLKFSILDLFQKEQQELIKKYNSDEYEKSEPVTLGNLLDNLISGKKE